MKKSRWLLINTLFLVLLAFSVCFWLIQWNTFGLCIAIVTLIAIFYAFKRNRWAYFVIAIICFGLLRIAMDDGHDFFMGQQSLGKLFYLLGLISALVLHEKVALKKASD